MHEGNPHPRGRHKESFSLRRERGTRGNSDCVGKAKPGRRGRKGTLRPVNRSSKNSLMSGSTFHRRREKWLLHGKEICNRSPGKRTTAKSLLRAKGKTDGKKKNLIPTLRTSAGTNNGTPEQKFPYSNQAWRKSSRQQPGGKASRNLACNPAGSVPPKREGGENWRNGKRTLILSGPAFERGLTVGTES